jgi:hypothetical protein
VEGMYLYTPQTNPTVICRNSKTRTDWTRRSSVTVRNRKLRWVTGRADLRWSDAPIKDDWTRRSGMTGRVRSCKSFTGKMTWRTTVSDHRWLDALGHLRTLLERDRMRRSLHSRVRLRCLPSGTCVRLTTASGPLKDRVRSISWTRTVL